MSNKISFPVRPSHGDDTSLTLRRAAIEVGGIETEYEDGDDEMPVIMTLNVNALLSKKVKGKTTQMPMDTIVSFTTEDLESFLESYLENHVAEHFAGWDLQEFDWEPADEDESSDDFEDEDDDELEDEDE